MLDQPGVYMIRSRTTGEKYIGGTEESFSRRFANHRTRLAGNAHSSPRLQAIYNRYGADDLEFVPLKAFPVDQVRRREQEAVQRLKPELNTHRAINADRVPEPIDKPVAEMSVEEIAAAAGVHPLTIKYRMSVGATGDELLVSRRVQRVDVGGGRMLSAKEIAKEAGLALPTVHARIARGLTGPKLMWKRVPK